MRSDADGDLHDRRPLVFLDFDGVLNQFPDDKVRRRGNAVDWMRPDDPRRASYAPDRWFVPDMSAHVRPGGMRLRILWSSELVRRLDALDADIVWLSTWQPYTGLLNHHLGVEWETIRWYDPVTGLGRLTGKRRTVRNALALRRPIVWVDDEEVSYDAGLALQSTPHDTPVLMVGPDAHTGISRPQFDAIARWVASPPEDESVTAEVSGNGHDGHWGF